MSTPTSDQMDRAHAKVNELLDGIREDVERVDHKFTETGEQSAYDVDTISRLVILLRAARSSITL